MMTPMFKIAAALAVALSAACALALPATPAAAIDGSEVSAAFYVKFDKLPSPKLDCGPFSVSAEADGRVTVTGNGGTGTILWCNKKATVPPYGTIAL